MMRSFAVSLFVMSLFACPPAGGSDGGTGGGSGAGGGTGNLTAFSFCEQVQNQRCDFAVRCGQYVSASACEAANARLYLQFPDTNLSCVDVVEPINDGRRAFHADVATACFSAAQTSCNATALDCPGATTGLGNVGDDCFVNDDCGTGLHCGGDGTCPGHCAANKAAGVEVQSGVACGADLFAHPEQDGGAFVLVCRGQGDAGVPCAQSDACLAGLVCEFNSGVCVKQGGEGTLCNDNSLLCATGLSCQPSTDGGLSKCGGYASRGETCGQCKLDLRCLRDGGVNGVCGDLSGDGGDCFADSDCATPLWCNSMTTKCQAPPGAGDSCDGISCPAGLSCLIGDAGSEVCVAIDGGTFEITCADTGE
jgi:hypothetical protein